MPREIPQPTDTDHEDVHWALSTATSLHAQGDRSEALRWLRRAISAAVEQNDDSRAAELGRSALSLEAALTGAQTHRRNTTDVMPPDIADERTTLAEHFDLDQPTHVDSSSRHIHVEDTNDDAELSSTDGEITLVPYTMKAAGVPAPRRQPPPVRRVEGTRSKTHVSPGVTSDLPAYVEDGDENTLAMRAPPNQHEISDVDSMPGAPVSQTADAIAPVPRHRVVLLASPDGHDPRVMLLRNGMDAPPGAGVAVLIPATSQDARVIAQLLHPKEK